MTTYTYSQPQQAPAQQSGPDVAAWALVALVVALICAAAGWAIARNDAPSRNDVARSAELAAREASVAGESIGYRNGAATGRAENALRTKLAVAQAKQQGSADGYGAGYVEGRSRAQSRQFGLGGYGLGSSLGTSGAYPSAGYEDILASGAFSDVPGYSSSTYDAAGYGATSTPYPATGLSSLGTSYGDDYGY